MGSVVNGITGLFSGGGSNPNSNAGSIAGLGSVANQQGMLAGQLDAQGNQIFGPAFGQYNAGINDVLTPAQSSLVSENLGTMNTQTQGTYGDLGLGGSTMESQDMAGNSLRSMAERANLDFSNEELGLKGLQEALGYYGGAGTELGGAATSLSDAGRLQTANTQQLNSALQSLGNKPAGGSAAAPAGGAASSLLGGGGGTAAADLSGGALGGGAALGAADAGLGTAGTDAGLGLGAADLLGTTGAAGSGDLLASLFPLALAA